MYMQLPKAIIHNSCGELLFLYVGPTNDAQILLNPNNIMAMDGGDVNTTDVWMCRHCHGLIATRDLSVEHSEEAAKIWDEVINNLVAIAAENDMREYQRWLMMEEAYGRQKIICEYMPNIKTMGKKWVIVE